MQEEERIQKVIARGGKYSRRQVEQLLIDQRITVNNTIAELGCKVSKQDRIRIDNKPIRIVSQAETTIVIAYNKRVGEVCSRTEKKSVFANLPQFCPRWIGVGRLDINTSGLLLFTNDGQLAHRLAHPSSQLDREYAVRVRGEITDDVRNNLVSGVMLEDGKARFHDVVNSGGKGTNHWVHVVVQEGRYRLVRRLFQSQGLEVSRLIRVRFATALLTAAIRPGRWVELTQTEVKNLQIQASSSS